jgi:hypothetical protein
MLTKDTCPDKANHTPCPSGYIHWHEWAEKKIRTHKSTRCPICGLYAIWVPRTKKALEGKP